MSFPNVLSLGGVEEIIKEWTLEQIPLSEIKFDKSNPNVVSNEEMDSIRAVMRKYGFLSPVVVRKKTMMPIDGEHRARIYLEFEKKTIPGYIVDVTKIEGKMLRQILNKLRGTHDKQKDAFEFKLIKEAEQLEEFAKLLATHQNEFEKAIRENYHFEEKEAATIDGELDTQNTCPKCGYQF